MTLQNAIKELQKANLIVSTDDTGKVTGHREGEDRYVGFHRSAHSAEITCVHTSRFSTPAEPMMDYFPQTWHNSVTAAIKFIS